MQCEFITSVSENTATGVYMLALLVRVTDLVNSVFIKLCRTKSYQITLFKDITL